MNIFTKMTLGLALVLGAGTAYAAAPALHAYDHAARMPRGEQKSVFESKRFTTIEQTNNRMFRNAPKRFAQAVENAPEPFVKHQPAEIHGDMDAIGTDRFYYSGVFEYDTIPPHDNVMFYDYILKAYTFTIFDENFKEVGKIHDTMDYQDDEVRVAMCDLAPVMTKNFFNADENYEIMLGLGVNSQPGINHYRTLIYSLGAPKQDGLDKPVQVFNSLLADVLDASKDGKEEYYLTFGNDLYPDEFYEDPDDYGTNDDRSYWEIQLDMKVGFVTYGAAGADGKLTKVLEQEIPMMQLPGDMMSSPYMISFMHDNTPYILVQKYSDPWYNEYESPFDENISQRENNKLIVEIYKNQNGKFSLDYTTNISFSKDDSDEVIGSYYSVGSLRYRSDIDFDHFNTPAGKAALFITKDNYIVGNDDSYISSYYVYDHTGKKLKTLATDCTGAMALSDINGFEPQVLFIEMLGGAYWFTFKDIYSNKTAFDTSYLFEIDPDMEPLAMTASIDRTPVGDSYEYVDELRVPALDDYDNDIMRFLRISKDGKFAGIDEVNMGPSVQYAMSYIECDALRPESFHSDANREYLILVKRGEGGGTVEQLLVSQAITDEMPMGNTLLFLEPEERGVLNTITPYLKDKTPNLVVYYYDAPTRRYSRDFYALPLDKATSGITAPTAPEDNIFFNGGIITATGTISIYDAAGALVAKGKDSFDTASLTPGFYIAVAEGQAKKLYIK